MISLENVDRGMHQLELQAFDENGKLIASSQKATFYLMRTSLNSPTRTTPKSSGG
jgi:hypothetical protein